jgi:2-polyprenyl-6-methoxyphenol hydroxylase-like FAD-dependent oxidoreductase
MSQYPTAQSPFDVVIVGARAAGAATAMLLARAGVRVALLDRSWRGADTLSTHALMRPGVLQLHRWDLLDPVISAGTPPVRKTTFTYADRVIPIPIKPGHGVDALYAPRRTVLDPILVDAAAAAGADVRFGLTVTGLSRDRTGRPDGVVARTRGRSSMRIPARLVVGADGIRSTIARLVDAPVLRSGTAAAAFTYGYWNDLPTDGYEWIFRPEATAGVIPTNDGLACVFVSAGPPGIGRGGVPVIREIVGRSAPELADRLAAATRPDRTWTFPGRPGHMRQAWGPGWALVGDAGYYRDPIGAHGLTDALRDAELLARAIIATHDGGTENEALAEYQSTRDMLSHTMFDVVDTVATHRWTDAEIGGLLLRLNAVMNNEIDYLAGLDALPVGPAVSADALDRAAQ